MTLTSIHFIIFKNWKTVVNIVIKAKTDLCATVDMHRRLEVHVVRHEIKNNITHTENKPSLCFNCLYQSARKALFWKELYHRRLRLSLCRSPLSFLTCGGSYLVRPCCWIIPLTNNPFATVQGMRAPAGSPPGPAGAASPPLAFQSSSRLRTGSCVSSPWQWLAGARERGPSEVPLQAQMLQLCLSVCRPDVGGRRCHFSLCAERG